MRRREFTAGIISAAGTMGVNAQTAAALPLVLLVSAAPIPTFGRLRTGLSDMGYVEGRTHVVQEIVGDLSKVGDQLARRKVDVIFAASPVAIRAALAVSSTVPIVGFDLESNPVEEGFVQSFARPGGTVTGIFLDQPGLATKWLEFLTQAVPVVSRVAVLWDSRTTPAQVKAVQALANRFSVQVEVYDLLAELDSTFTLIGNSGANGLVILSSQLSFALSSKLAELASRARLPAISMFRDFAERGGLLSYGPELDSVRLRTASFVDRILKGAKPAEIPVEQPTKFQLLLNVKTASVLGLAIPPTLLARADEVIE